MTKSLARVSALARNFTTRSFKHLKVALDTLEIEVRRNAVDDLARRLHGEGLAT
ncbi:hypothetical protein [Rhizobium leguminosarum]|uniref:hypothetical protein n=1 Tax=Rhizobium leguminosarum TaxID=384 RepID=UPI003F9B6551